MSADLPFTTDSFFFFISYLLRSLNGTQPTPSACSEVSAIWKCRFEMSSPPTNQGPQNHLFRRFRNVMTSLTAYIYGTKYDIDKRSSVLQTTRGLLHRVKTTWTLVHKRLQIVHEFSPAVRKICIPLHYQASQMEISKRNSTKLCQTVGGRSR